MQAPGRGRQSRPSAYDPGIRSKLPEVTYRPAESESLGPAV